MSSCLVLIHKAPGPLLQHIEWTISGITQEQVALGWIANSDVTGTYRSSYKFQGQLDAGATLASAFMNLKQITFEIVQDPADGVLGSRWSFTPNLGIFRGSIDEAGNLVVSENQLRYAMELAGPNALKLQAEIRRLLGQVFDDELEGYRELIGGSESNYGVVTAEAEGIAYRQNVRPL